MSELSEVSKTLFVPMEARVYASEHFPHILYDEMALSIKDKLPQDVLKSQNQSQYTYMASAVRSMNMDRYVRDFLQNHEDGIIVELGIGLETTFFRAKESKSLWFGIDFPEVIEYRNTLYPQDPRQVLVGGSCTDDAVLASLLGKTGDHPVLFLASGLFQYFPYEEVIDLLNKLKRFPHAEIVFDCVSKSGMRYTKKYMKQLGHEDAAVYFYVQKKDELVKATKEGTKVLHYEKFYAKTKKSGMSFQTKFNMVASDLLSMVKMVHLAL